MACSSRFPLRAGLQIFPEGTLQGEAVAAGTFEAPPPLCKKGGAKFRISCDDDGYYNGGIDDSGASTGASAASAGLEENAAAAGPATLAESSSSSSSSVLAAARDAGLASESDALRAAQRVPGAAYRSETGDFGAMAHVLNTWLQEGGGGGGGGGGAAVKPCDEFEVSELRELQVNRAAQRSVQTPPLGCAGPPFFGVAFFRS